jgi:AraC-like DNA-binding protein
LDAGLAKRKSKMSKQRKPNNQGVERRDVNAAERATMAIDLLKQRLSYDEIASRCGYSSRSAAYTAIQRELRRRIHPKIDEYRDQELLILDHIHQEVWIEAFHTKDKDGNLKRNLWAVDRLIELSKDRRKLLNLDVTPEQELANQNYTKKIILTHTDGGIDGSSIS